jgi:hypothetical protein
MGGEEGAALAGELEGKVSETIDGKAKRRDR